MWSMRARRERHVSGAGPHRADLGRCRHGETAATLLLNNPSFLSRRLTGDRKHSQLEGLDYRIAVSRFESAFEACTRLQEDDRELLLTTMAQQMLSQFGSSNDIATSDTAVPLGVGVPLSTE